MSSQSQPQPGNLKTTNQPGNWDWIESVIFTRFLPSVHDARPGQAFKNIEPQWKMKQFHYHDSISISICVPWVWVGDCWYDMMGWDGITKLNIELCITWINELSLFFSLFMEREKCHELAIKLSPFPSPLASERISINKEMVMVTCTLDIWEWKVSDHHFLLASVWRKGKNK